MDSRPKCSVEGCGNTAKSNGHLKDGSRKYRKYCRKHIAIISGTKRKGSVALRRERFPNKKCILCGWEGPCDRHRIVLGKDGGQYRKGNVAILCPNCHRLLHLGRLSIG
jgi:hypothetical protein